MRRSRAVSCVDRARVVPGVTLEATALRGRNGRGGSNGSPAVGERRGTGTALAGTDTGRHSPPRSTPLMSSAPPARSLALLVSTDPLRVVAPCLLVCALLACAGPNGRTELATGDARFDDPSWDDGRAVVSVFRGRVQRYGEWRDAVVRDYLVREFLDPQDRTKRDDPGPRAIPVLKANRLLEFDTGTYGYRLMGSFHFRRDDAALVRARGSCQNACGLVTQAWDVEGQALRSDSYWEYEGLFSTPLAAGDWRFADELAFVASTLPAGSELRVVGPIAAPRSIVQPPAKGETTAGGIGIGDLCLECTDPGVGVRPPVDGAPRRVGERVLRVERSGRTTRFVADDGRVEAEFVVDERGYLESWRIRDEQEFERTTILRTPYWERTSESDRASVSAR